MFGYLASSCFMYTSQAFWLVALAAADRIAIWPLLPISAASRLTSDSPICSVFAWLMNRWFGDVPQVTSESNETILDRDLALAADFGRQQAHLGFADLLGVRLVDEQVVRGRSAGDVGVERDDLGSRSGPCCRFRPPAGSPRIRRSARCSPG